jgi:2-desacetyl-2-hydroxyethyl bacteriochlorophyllide A dehydrogenase
MWTSTLEMSIKRVLPTRIMGYFWRGAYFSSFAPLQVHNLPRQPLASSQSSWVRVHNLLAGISGNDQRLVFAAGDSGIAPAALPQQRYIYPGHEVIGEVVEIGEHVQSVHVGDRVVLQSDPNCLSAGVQPPCLACATGNYNLCESADFPGMQQLGGGWSEEMLLSEQQLFLIPDTIEDEQAVLLEPTAIALHAVLRRFPQPGETVLIIGAGAIGLLTLQVLRALAPQVEVSVMARHNFQIEMATRLGAAHIVYERDSYENIEKATGARLFTGALGNKMLLGGYDVIYNTIGSGKMVHHSLRWARARGTVVLIGSGLHQMRFDPSPILYQEVNLIGTMGHGLENWPPETVRQRSTFAIAADLIANGLLHPEHLITHRFALNNFREALLTATNKKLSRSIKVIFDAALLPAMTVPSGRVATSLHMPVFVGNASQSPATPLPIEADMPLVASSPSQFTMAQSEDFTADFDNTQFSTFPKPRRPPSALQFHNTIEDLPVTPRPANLADAKDTSADVAPVAEDFEEVKSDWRTSSEG